MLHSTPRPRILALSTAVIVGLLGTLTAAPAAADPAATVRLVQHADGRLEVLTGTAFAAAGATVLVEEADVALSTAGLLDELIDTATGLVSDELRGDQWNLDEVEAERAWTRADGAGQVVAIIDSGVDGDHPDLVDRLVPGTSTTGGDELVDALGHGTHVAGTAAASLGDGYGVAGLAHRASIMPVQVTDATGMAYASDVAEGLLWAVDHGATVVNMSLAGTAESRVLSAAIDHAVAEGVVVVAAGGNEFNRGNPATWPASHPSVIAVASLRDSATRSAFSSTGDWVDIAAPGSSILSTRPDAAFGYASGTSMAAPLVAGAAALLLGADPTLDPQAVRDLLLDHSTDIGRRGWDAEFGEGALDVTAALEEITAAPPVQDPAPVPTPEGMARTPGLFDGSAYRRG